MGPRTSRRLVSENVEGYQITFEVSGTPKVLVPKKIESFEVFETSKDKKNRFRTCRTGLLN
jgi:hypothetical protein